MTSSPAFIAMAMAAGSSLDEALALLAAPPTDPETVQLVGSLRSPDRAVRAHALALAVARISRALEDLDVQPGGGR